MIQSMNKFFGLESLSYNASMAFYCLIAFAILAIIGKMFIEYRLRSDSPKADSPLVITGEVGSIIGAMVTFVIMISYFVDAIK